MPTEWLVRPDGTIAYDEQGSGPLVICVPGMGDLRGEYRFLAPQLARAGYRVVTMDLRGHGQSTAGWPDYSKPAIASDIAALARHLDAGPAHLIGTSYAAGSAVLAAAEAPDLVSGVVLIGPFVRDHGRALQNRLTQWLYTALFAGPWGAAVWTGYFPKLFPTRKPDDFTGYVQALRANLGERGRMQAFRAMMRASSAASAAALTHVRAPTLVVMGTRDSDFKAPQDEAAWIAEQAHGCYQMIAGAGHYPHVEMPDETGRAIVAFLLSIHQQAAAHGR